MWNAGRARILQSAMALAATIVLAAGSAAAGEHVVSQKNRTFHPAVVEAKVGDTVVFVNDDRFAHNIYSETPGFEFDSRKQMPGERHVIRLDKRGTFEVRCAIHPRMRMKIVVK